MAVLDTPVCDFGWKAQDFKLKDPDGKEYSMTEAMGENGLLVAFICNHCPYVKAVIGRLVADAKVLQEEGFGVLAVMANDYESYPDDSPNEMRRFAAEHKFTFPYLVDEDQSVAKSYDAVCTPDFFGFNRDFELQYRGRLDDAERGDASDRVPELLNAFRHIAKTGAGPKEQTPSMGCSMKWR
ncbi:MAG: thioredoxin family protein [Pseudohongiellaceae bacterium]